METSLNWDHPSDMLLSHVHAPVDDCLFGTQSASHTSPLDITFGESHNDTELR